MISFEVLCLLILASSDQHPWLTPSDDKQDLNNCVETHPAEVIRCLEKFNTEKKEHIDEINNHRSDPENIKDSTKKEVCCAKWNGEDCMLDVSKDSTVSEMCRSDQESI